jgi:hypothetical protein
MRIDIIDIIDSCVNVLLTSKGPRGQGLLKTAEEVGIFIRQTVRSNYFERL